MVEVNLFRRAFPRKQITARVVDADLAGRAAVPIRPVEEHEFRLVTLPEPSRHCAHCAHSAYRVGMAVRHERWHAEGSSAHLPHLWRVTGEVRGDEIPTGTTLSLVSAVHQVFYEWGGWDSIHWLLEARDGPRTGDIYQVSTTAMHDDPAFPLWPEGLEPLSG